MVYVLRITTDSESAVVQGVLYPVEVSSHTRVDFRKLAAAITEGHKANNVKPASVDVEEVQRPSAITLYRKKGWMNHTLGKLTEYDVYL